MVATGEELEMGGRAIQAHRGSRQRPNKLTCRFCPAANRVYDVIKLGYPVTARPVLQSRS